MTQIRKKHRQLSESETWSILEQGEYGVLSTVDKQGQPYGIPLSYAVHGECIYFHGAAEGHKLSNIRTNNRVCFTVVGRTLLMPQKFTTFYESAIVFGTISELENTEKEEALATLVRKYSPDYYDLGMAYIRRSAQETNVLKLNIEQVTGKSSRDPSTTRTTGRANPYGNQA